MTDDPFFKYQNEVDYDYIIEVEVPTEYTSREYGKPDEFQLNLLDGELEHQLESVLYNEDYLKYGFPEIAVGRVYPVLIGPVSECQIRYGISLIDAEQPVTLQDLIEDAKELSWEVVTETDGEDINGTEDREPDKIYIETKGDRDDIKVKVIKYPNKKESIAIEYDKKLVAEGKLIFADPTSVTANNNVILALTDEGTIEITENNKIVKAIPFSKTVVANECKALLDRHMILCESEIKIDNNNTIDTDQEKANMEKASKELDEIQDLKDEIQNKVDKIFNENKSANDFISTQDTKRVLSKAELCDVNLSNILTPEQIQWIEKSIDTLPKVQSTINAFARMLPLEDNEPAINIDTYIEELYNNLNKEGE